MQSRKSLILLQIELETDASKRFILSALSKEMQMFFKGNLVKTKATHLNGLVTPEMVGTVVSVREVGIHTWVEVKYRELRGTAMRSKICIAPRDLIKI